MKKKLKSFEEFEQLLKDEKIDIRPAHKQEIITQMTTRPIKRKPKIVSSAVIVCACLLLTISIGVAKEFSGLTFFTKNGSSVVEITTMEEDELNDHLEYSRHSYEMKKLMEDLSKGAPEGKYYAFLDMEAYEQTGFPDVTYLQKGEHIYTAKEIPVTFAPTLHFTDSLLGEYELRGGDFSYKMPEQSTEEFEKLSQELIQQAERENSPYAVLEGDLLPDVSDMMLTYEVKFNPKEPDWRTIVLFINPIQQTVRTSEDLTSFKLVSKGERDFYYSEEKRMLLFIEEGQTENYLVKVWNPVISEKNIPMEQFFEIADGLIGLR